METESKENYRNSSVKMASYLEKRGKKKVISSWKKYWFVLDDRLLLYYKSELEYINLSACKGSINMGLATCVKPGSPRNNTAHPAFIVDIVTRAQIISLRTKDRSLQEQWIQALLDSMALPSTPAPLGRPMQFRYSMDNLPVVKEDEQKAPDRSEKQNTLPSETKPTVSRQDSILKKIKALGGQSYGGSMDTILKLKNLNHKVKHSENSDVHKAFTEKRTEVLHDEDISQNTHKEHRECDVKSTHVESDKPDESYKNEISLVAIKSNSIENKNCESDNEINGTLREQNLNSENHVSSKPSKDYELISNNKLGVKTHNEPLKEENCDNSYDRERTSLVVENKYYQDAERLGEALGEKTGMQQKVEEENSLKEMKIETVCTSEYAEPNVNFNVPEDEYSDYDPLLLQNDLEKRNDSVQEPTLPPRPHASIDEDNHHEAALVIKDSNNGTTFYENAEYENFYVDDKASESMIRESKENSEVKNSLFKKLKKKNQNTENSNKDDLKFGEEEQTPKDKRRKHKKSFLKKVLNRYRKKTSEQVEKKEEANDPEYEVVEFVHTTTETVKQEEVTSTDENKTETGVAVTVTEILPRGIMKELKQKITDRKNSLSDDKTKSEDEEQEDYEEVCCPASTTENVAIETVIPKPSPISKVKLIGISEKDFDKGETRPGLPPRQVPRPHSPWHDIPSNNSSIYDSITNSTSTNEHTVPETKIQDDLLGTPEGYVLVREKWLEAERSQKDAPTVIASDTAKKQNSSEAKENSHLTDQLIDEINNTKVIKQNDVSLLSEPQYNSLDDKHCLTSNLISFENFNDDDSAEKCSEIVHNIENGSKADNSPDCSNNDVPKMWVSEISDIHLSNVDKRNSTESYCKVNSLYCEMPEAENETVAPKINIHNEYENVETITVIKVIDDNMNINFQHKDVVDIEKDSLILSVDCSELEDIQTVDSLSPSPLENSLIDQDIYHYSENLSTDNKAQMNLVLQDSTELIFQDTVYHPQCLGHIVESDNQEATKAFKCIRYNTDGALAEECVVPMNKRHSNELNILLAQLAELTSAPLLSPGVTISLIDFPPQQSSVDQFDINKLGPIRRRRHSDPDYDIPRPHRSLVKSLPVECMGTQNVNEDRQTPPIEPTRFLEQKRMEEFTSCTVNTVANNISISPDSLDSPDTILWFDQ